MIIDLPDDKKITEDGFYRISLDRHHNQPCDGISVTSSVLRKMELETPADVWAFHQLNPDRYPSEDTTALRLGRAMAAYIEGGEGELGRVFQITPPDPPRRPTDIQIERYRSGNGTAAGIASCEFWLPLFESEKDVLAHGDVELIRAMGSALVRDPAACAALGGEPEVTMAVYDRQTDLWLLARPDQVEFSGMLSDYKKVSTRGMPFNYRLVDRRITAHGYDMQMAFAAECFEALTGDFPSQVGLVFQCDKPPYHSILREIDEETLRIGQFRNRRSLIRFRECLDSGHWPGPGEDIGAYQMPEWLYESLLEQMETEMAA